MKRVLIVTMHRGNNYGSALQTYALSETIKRLRHIPQVLDYVPSRINHKSAILNALRGLVRGNLRDKYLSLRGLMILISSKRCYDTFFSQNINLTQSYNSIQEIMADNVEADVYMTGSDQVWNSLHNKGVDEVFYLSFAPENKLKVSYSASFGREKLEPWEIEPTRKALMQYKYITVREKSGLDVLESIGIHGGKCVLDPTFLLDKAEWDKRAKRCNNVEKYVLIYSVEPDKESIIKIARQIADRLNAKVYMVEWGFKPYPEVDKMICLPNPLKLVDYFSKAEFVVASSFHGTALSLNLNRQFISLAPAKFNTRVKSILELVNEQQRLVTFDDFNIDKALEEIDFKRINSILDRERGRSINILKEMIG